MTLESRYKIRPTPTIAVQEPRQARRRQPPAPHRNHRQLLGRLVRR